MTSPRKNRKPAAPARAPSPAGKNAARPLALLAGGTEPEATPPLPQTPTARAVQVLEPAPAGDAARPGKAAKGGKTPKAAEADKPGKPAKAAGEKDDKARKPKLVRDSFTIPKAEYAAIETLKERAVRLGRPMKKSELLRAGLKALAAMPDAQFLAGVAAVPTVKTGRPAKA